MKKAIKEKDMTAYTIEEAITKIKASDKAKFDATIEVHINLELDKKTEQSVRFTTILPHGTGKTKKVAVFASKKVPNADIEFTEADIEKLEKSVLKPKIDFDVIVAEPRFMPKLAKAARVLGPAGVMPNPKTGTVAEDVEKAVEQIKKGKIEVRTEPSAPNMHTIIGKKSFEDVKLIENFNELMAAIKTNKPQKAQPEFIKSVFLSSTMGTAIRVQA